MHFIGVYGNLTARWTGRGHIPGLPIVGREVFTLISFLPLQTPGTAWPGQAGRLESGGRGESRRSSMVRGQDG